MSEGRGTTQPFELFGAPYIAPEELRAMLPPDALTGVVLREAAFAPVANKWAGCLCKGFQVHVTDPENFHPYRLGLNLMRGVIALWPNAFQWKSPPYEYEYEKLPMDLILGDDRVRKRITAMASVSAVEADWQEDLAAFRRIRKTALLY